jgi:putative sporulation protein YyaC
MLSNKIKVYGTLQSPVHALNLNSVMQAIEESFTSPYIIAVDACLGTHIGCVALSEGGLVPGAGVNKMLTPSSIGQLSITGIVGSCHGNTLNTLSTVRLNSVVELAEIISEAIVKSLSP